MDGVSALSPRLPVLAVLVFAAVVAAWQPGLARRVRAAAPQRLLAADFGPEAPVWRRIAVLLLLGALALVTLTRGDYGYNVDEWLQGRHGIALVDWYARVLSGSFVSFAPQPTMAHYGGFFELVAELASRASPLERTETRHLVTAWCGVAGLWAAYLLGATLHSRAAGCLAIALLGLTPRFYGHFFNNPKDLPFAVGMSFALVVLCRALPRLPRLPLADVLGLGVVIGLAMAVRIAGLLALLTLGFGLACWLAAALRRAPAAGGPPSRAELLALARSGLGVAAVAWVVMLLFWPWALEAPLTRPFQSMGYFRDLEGVAEDLKAGFLVFFDGRHHLLGTLPRHYTLQFLLISLPEFALLAPVALFALVRWLRERPGSWTEPPRIGWAALAVAVALPLATTASRGIVQFDGVRHFLFVVPPLVVALAAGLVALWTGPTPAPLKAGVATALLGLAALTAWDMRALHPYQYVYFNRSVAGGLPLAATRYETDYLGLSYREGVRWVLANYDASPGRPVRIASCRGFHPNLRDGLARDPEGAAGFVPVRPRERPELVLALTRGRCHERFLGRVLTRIERVGTPLLYVIQVDA